MKINTHAFVFLLFFLSLSCKGQNQDQNTWSSEALIMPQGVNPDSLPDPLSEGAKLEIRFCSQCHGIPSPANHTSSDWVPVFRRMILLMNRSNSMGMMGRGMMNGRMPMGMMHGIEVPDVTQQKELLAYLQAHALVSVNEKDIPQSDSQEAKLFAQKCSQCHALPSPSQHTASQWPSVVNRMRQHIIQNHLSLTEEQAKEISDYLEKHAAK